MVKYKFKKGDLVSKDIHYTHHYNSGIIFDVLDPFTKYDAVKVICGDVVAVDSVKSKLIRIFGLNQSDLDLYLKMGKEYKRLASNDVAYIYKVYWIKRKEKLVEWECDLKRLEK